MVRGENEQFIDRSYYNALVDAAVETISLYGDFEWFVSDDPYISDKREKPPCGDNRYETCFDCPRFHIDKLHTDCDLGYDLSDYLVQHKVKNN